ncbi:MAG TPA: hypothetical protein VLS49_15825, partial [Usitatibacter sp.]|nr:hypothetical protein [Usitatibacter sp.]
MSRFNAILLLALAVFVSPAFSDDAPTSTTTRARIVGPMPPPQGPSVYPQNPPENEDIDPATGLSRSTVVQPLRELSSPPGSQPV